jgi:predicted N-acetyltransferase YhbS
MMLMREGLKRAETMGHGLVLLVGDEPYYGRLGFKRLPHDLLLMPGPLNRARFLYLELKPGALQPAAGLILPPWRHAELSAALAVPHGAHRQQQGRKTQQG